MATATLQQLMVINKGSSLPLLIKAKSFALDLVTWALWAYIITVCREICGTHLHETDSGKFLFC